MAKALWGGTLFNANAPTPGPGGAQMNFGRNADTGALELTDTTGEVAAMIFGCMFDAEEPRCGGLHVTEARCGGLHVAEGSFQRSITASVRRRRARQVRAGR